MQRFLRAPSVALPTRICHAEPLARPTVVINCVVLHRFTTIGPAVREGVCGPAPRHPPCCVRRLNKQARGGACTRWSGEGFRRCSFHTHWTSLFSRRPSSRHFYLTTRCAPQQPIGADVPMQQPGVVIMTVIKTALAPSPPCIRGGKTIAGTCAKKKENEDRGDGRNSPSCYLKLLRASRYFSWLSAFPWVSGIFRGESRNASER